MTRRWVCPTCGGGVLAPSRPRKDDVRRYCLPCSKKSGRLVPRSCPAADAARTKREGRRADRQTAEVLRQDERDLERHTVDGLDVRDEWKRLLRLPFVRERCAQWAGLRPRLKVSRARSDGSRAASGRCWPGSGDVHVTIHERASRADAEFVLTHELAHAICNLGAHHGSEWRNSYARLVREAYGVDVPTTGGASWALDSRVVAALRARD